MKDPYYQYFKEEREDKILVKTLNRMFYAFLIVLLLVTSFSGYMHERYMYFQVTGISMQDTLNPNPNEKETQDGVIVDKYTKTYHRGDIIVLKDAKVTDREKYLIKRIIGLPGDYITVKLIEINGRKEFRLYRQEATESMPRMIYEDYIDYYDWYSTPSYTESFDGVTYDKTIYDGLLRGGEDHDDNIYKLSDGALYFKVPEDRILYMGDNRSHSLDSRSAGPALISNIVGRVAYISQNVYYDIRPGFTEMVSFARFIYSGLVNLFSW